MPESYDSRPDTLNHIGLVKSNINEVIEHLTARAIEHDISKLQEPELALFNKYTPLLAKTEYGSEEYKAFLSQMAPALVHHYTNNSHHPEHYGPAGIEGMSLLDLLEMLADWKAASGRNKGGSLVLSMELNRIRFRIPDALFEMLERTARKLGWIP